MSFFALGMQKRWGIWNSTPPLADGKWPFSLNRRNQSLPSSLTMGEFLFRAYLIASSLVTHSIRGILTAVGLYGIQLIVSSCQRMMRESMTTLR